MILIVAILIGLIVCGNHSSHLAQFHLLNDSTSHSIASFKKRLAGLKFSSKLYKPQVSSMRKKKKQKQILIIYLLFLHFLFKFFLVVYMGGAGTCVTLNKD